MLNSIGHLLGHLCSSRSIQKRGLLTIHPQLQGRELGAHPFAIERSASFLHFPVPRSLCVTFRREHSFSHMLSPHSLMWSPNWRPICRAIAGGGHGLGGI